MVERFGRGESLTAVCVVFDSDVVGAEGEDEAVVYVGVVGEAGGRFCLPAAGDVGGGVSADAEVVVGDGVAVLVGGGAEAAGPAEVGGVGRAVDERVADEADAGVGMGHDHYLTGSVY